MPVDDFFQEYGPIQRRRGTAGHPMPSEPSEPPEPLKPRPQHRSRRRSRFTRRRASPLRLFFSLALFLVALLAALPYAFHVLYYEQALPGVSVQGLPLAGQSREVIQSALDARYAEFLDQPITLHYNDQRFRPALAEIGVRFAIADLTDRVIATGRQGDPLSRAEQLWSLWREGYDLTPRLIVDEHVLQNYLLGIAAEIEQAPENAALSLAEGKIIGTPSTPGFQLLIDESSKDVLAALRTLTPQDVVLRTRRLEPSINDAALIAAQDEARRLLSSPLLMRHDEREWIWEPARIAEMVHVHAGRSSLTVTINSDQLGRAVEDLAQLVDTGSAEPRLRFEAGALRIAEPGRPGWRLDQAATVQAISSALHMDPSAAGMRALSLPVVEVQPQITAESLGELGIRELVGRGQSSFAGSAQYRITNIKAGARRMDGVLIAPDEEFSFNTQLGEVTAAYGFVQGYAVIGNRTQLEWGGGVCQDSTTVFRAAFWAGLPITERHAHPFYISWYDRFGLGEYGNGAGLDAAIFTGVNDLKFVNDTGNWLLMQTVVDEANQVLTVDLYGTRPDRTVSIEGPFVSNVTPPPPAPVFVDDPTRPSGTSYQSDVAREGRDIMIYRVISENGVEARRDEFLTRFRAWPNVFVRGTG
jgi:vancomycin resistance protein YoaR